VLGSYVSALLIIGVSVILGRGICALARNTSAAWLGPPVGFAALMVICQVALSLPGRGPTAVAVVVVACIGSVLVAAGRRVQWPSAPDAVVVGLGILVFTAVPFLANDRVGVLGIGFLNDTHWHFLLAEGLLHPSVSAYGYGVGYPLGPHAIAATFAEGIGSSVDRTFTGLLIATPILTGLAALGALRDLSSTRRWLVAILAGIPYLAAAWYVQSAFKEPILSLLLLGLLLALADGRRDGFTRPLAVAVPVAVLLAGVLYDYSYPGLVWVVAIVACWLLLEFVLGGAWRHLLTIRQRARSALPASAIGVFVLLVLLAPDISRIHAFWLNNGGTSVGNYGGVTSTSLANLYQPLYSFEGFNIWLSGDFRFAPANSLRAGVLVGFALIVVVYAAVSALERREFVWVGALLGFALTYAYVKHTQSPYVAAKALMVPGPVLALVAGRALMLRLERPDWRSTTGLVVAATAVVFFVFAFQSSYLALKDAYVGPNDHLNELRGLRRFLHGRQTLALFYDDYVQWELLGDPVSSPLLSSPIPVGFRKGKPFSYGQAMDFDSVDAATLDRFAYVITTRTDAQSQPPPNFHVIATSRSYEVWQRVGPTPPHDVLPESGAPGAVLDCHAATGRAIAHERGFAMVRPAPVGAALTALAPGASQRVTIPLAPGTWDLSLQFTSDQAITVRGPGLNAWLPPNHDRPGSYWPVGRVVSTGAPIVLTIRMTNPDLIHSDSQVFAPGTLIAVRPGADTRIPLRAACGRYVDWYVVT
jgi:hypothetical protein